MDVRKLVMLAVGLALAIIAGAGSVAQEPLTLPIRIDAGSDHSSLDGEGRLYLADQEWTPQARAGYIGGYRVWSSQMHPVDGTSDRLLHENQRHGWEEYRFSDVPNGDYVVTLSFSEIGIPIYTVFDVAIEGRTVLEDFRIFDQVGGNYALVRRFPATVTDGELNIVSTPIVGEPRLAAVEVEARSPDRAPPAVPAGLATTSSYNAVLLDWADNSEDDLDGYHVYRAISADGPYTRRTAEPVHVSRYEDAIIATHVTCHYCISAVDVYGNESDWTACQTSAALHKSDATLPYYELQVPSESQVYLYAHALSDDEVAGAFTYAGRTFPVDVRYRGGVGRYFHKKSWKVNFPDGSPFTGQDQINLRADYPDLSLMRTKLATELFEAAGVPVPRAEHVLLAVNGQYLGVYTYNEQVDEGFLARTGRDLDISIYKSVSTELNDFSRAQPTEEAYYAAYEKKTNRDMDYGDIIAFIELLNNTPDEMFAYELQRVFDVNTYLDYYAVIVLTSNSDFIRHNVYFLHDLRTDRWELVPYDLDAGFREAERPIDMGTSYSPLLDWELSSVLLTRVLDVPQFRAYYCDRLAEFLDTIFSEAAMDALIDETYAAIEQDGLRDWHKHGREENGRFAASPDELKAYVARRRSFLWNQMPAYCPADRPYLKINEIMADNRTTVANPDKAGLGGGYGEFPAWFEVYNQGLEPVDLSGMYVTDDLAAPHKFRIADGIIVPAGGFITLFADGGPEQGPLHTSFQLSASGGQIGIFSGAQQIDARTYGPQAADVSEGRYPDGLDRWRSFNVPTPGTSNLLRPPVIGDVTRVPLLPAASDSVAVLASISDDGAVLSATLTYSAAGSGLVEVPMTHVQGNLYAAQIGPQPSGSLVEYTIVAWDDDGRTSVATGDSSGAHYEYIVDYRPPRVFINEFMADNETTLSDPDEAGEFPDWIELHNPGRDAVDLGGRYLTDDPNAPAKFRIADGIRIPADGFLVFYADNDPEQGPLHTNFKLSKDGESVGLFDIDAAGRRPIDVRAFGPQAADVAEGRCPDGGDTFAFLDAPTPGTRNRPCEPGLVASKVSHIPLSVSAADEVTITAAISDGGTAMAVTLWYSAGEGFVAVPMRLGAEKTYTATLPPQPDGTTVAYYVQVEGEEGLSVTDPAGAPASTRHYVVGYQPPPLFINEFMADNATTLQDPDEMGEFPDWIELYNAGPASIDLGGKYLTDDLNDPTKFRIPDGLSVPAGGFVLFYADSDPGQGPLHTNFRLSRLGESIGLFDTDTTGNQLIDAHTFGPQIVDVSERRYPGGGEPWVRSRTPTPGSAHIARLPPYLPTVLRQMVG